MSLATLRLTGSCLRAGTPHLVAGISSMRQRLAGDLLDWPLACSLMHLSSLLRRNELSVLFRRAAFDILGCNLHRVRRHLALRHAWPLEELRLICDELILECWLLCRHLVHTLSIVLVKNVLNQALLLPVHQVFVVLLLWVPLVIEDLLQFTSYLVLRAWIALLSSIRSSSQFSHFLLLLQLQLPLLYPHVVRALCLGLCVSRLDVTLPLLTMHDLVTFIIHFHSRLLIFLLFLILVVCHLFSIDLCDSIVFLLLLRRHLDDFSLRTRLSNRFAFPQSWAFLLRLFCFLGPQ